MKTGRSGCHPIRFTGARAGPKARAYSNRMGFLLPDALAVKHSLGQSCRVVQGPSLDPDGWKRRRAKANENSLANVISLDDVRDEIEMHGSLGRTMDEVREDIAVAYAEKHEMDEAEADEELADGYEAYALLTEEYEGGKTASPESATDGSGLGPGGDAG